LPLPVGHQHHPVREFERPFDPLADICRQTELFIIELDSGAVEHPQHHLFAVQRRYCRNPKVDLVAAHRQLDAPVLR